MQKPVNLFDFDRPGLENFFHEIGEKPFRAKQMMQWIYKRQTHDFADMTDLSKSLREKLHDSCTASVPEIIKEQSSSDGTRKWLLALSGGNAVEVVYIPEAKRGTLCVSSQIGCLLTCSFCATAKQGFNRNLSVAEIIGQLVVADKRLTELGRPGAITNVVMMGMGEPLLNYNNVISAMKLMLDDFAYGISKRRVTLSTAGVVPQIYALMKDCPVSLAISLHSPFDELRDELVPINKKYPIAELLTACREYAKLGQRTRITFEYILIDGVNDKPEHARALIKLMANVPNKINLIPYNPVEGVDYQRSRSARVHAFAEILLQKGLTVMVRKTRGDDIDAACGQLAGKVNDKTRRQQQHKDHMANSVRVEIPVTINPMN